MIIVTGATGKLGSRIVERLQTLIPASEIAVSVREPQKAQALLDRGIRVRHGDFADAASLAHTFEGATQVFITSVDKLGTECVEQHRTAIDAAVAAGASRILYTSQMGADAASHFQACRDHAATEEILRTSGVPFTALRNGFYTDSALQFFDRVWVSGQLTLPADGPVSWTTHTDLADAAAAILADEGRFEGPTPPLTAGEAFTFDDVSRIVERATGRPCARTTDTDDAFSDRLIENGVPTEYARQFIGIFKASRAKEFATVNPALADLIGREPTPLSAALRAHLAEAS